MIRRHHKRVFLILAFLAACVGFGAAYQSMEDEDRLTTKRFALVCGAPLSLAALLTWTILTLSKRR